MAKDFRANQIRVSQLIGSGSHQSADPDNEISGFIPPFTFYSSSEATSWAGGFNSKVLRGVGKDVFFYVSGAIGGRSADNWPYNAQKDASVALFGGDLFVSGTLTAMSGTFYEIGKVSGSMYIQDNLYVSGTIVGGGLGGGWVDDGGTVRLDTSTDQVGIGTASPGNYKLAIEIGDSEDLAGVLIDHNEADAAKNSLTITNESTVGTARCIEATGKNVLNATVNKSGGYGIYVQRNIAEAGSYELVGILDRNTSNTQPALKIWQYGAAPLIDFYDGATKIGEITHNGKMALGTSSTATACPTDFTLVDNSSLSALGLYKYESGALPSAADLFAGIFMGATDDETNWDDGVRIYGGAAENWTEGSAAGSFLKIQTTPNTTASPVDHFFINEDGKCKMATDISATLSSPDEPLHIVHSEATSGFGHSIIRLEYYASNGFADGDGPGIKFAGGDAAAANNTLARISAHRAGADNVGSMLFSVGPNGAEDALYISSGSNVSIGHSGSLECKLEIYDGTADLKRPDEQPDDLGEYHLVLRTASGNSGSSGLAFTSNDTDVGSAIIYNDSNVGTAIGGLNFHVKSASGTGKEPKKVFQLTDYGQAVFAVNGCKYDMSLYSPGVSIQSDDSQTWPTSGSASNETWANFNLGIKNYSNTLNAFGGIAFDISSEADADSIGAGIAAVNSKTTESTEHAADLIFATNNAGGDDSLTERMRITHDGHVQINWWGNLDSYPTMDLRTGNDVYVGDDLYVYDDCTLLGITSTAVYSYLKWDSATGKIYYHSSTEKIKTNIVDNDSLGLSQISQLQPKNFDMKSGELNCIGLIAEQCYNVDERLAILGPDYEYDNNGSPVPMYSSEDDLSRNLKTLSDNLVPTDWNHDAVIVALINSVKELKARVEELESN